MTPEPGDGAYRDRARAESFGSLAASYDRVRPGYPAALCDDVATLGGVDTLDVGCGTGKLARPLAARGLRVLGVEIDAGMAEVARQHGTDVEVAGFEGWDDRGRRFDLLVSGQAWHWVDPVAGARRAAQVLRPDGHVALAWNVHAVAPELQHRLDAVYHELAPTLLGRMSGHASRGGSSADAAEPGLRAAGFTILPARDYAWQQDYERDEWLELLSTFSDHHLLPDAQRARLLTALGEQLDALGGSITVFYSTRLLLARARPSRD